MTYIYAWCMFHVQQKTHSTMSFEPLMSRYKNGVNLIITRSPVAGRGLYATRQLQQKELWNCKLWCHLLSGIEKHTSEKSLDWDIPPRPLATTQRTKVLLIEMYLLHMNISNVVQELKWPVTMSSGQQVIRLADLSNVLNPVDSHCGSTFLV